MTQIHLDGPWKIRRVALSPHRPELPAPEAGGWSEFRVPGQWQQHPDFADAPEAVMFTRRFDVGELANQPARIELEEVFYRAWVWINGRLLGEDRGWMFPHRHDVPAGLLSERGNTIHVLVHCGHENDPFNKRQILGVFGHWDGALPGSFAGGIAGSITLAALPEAELEGLHLDPVLKGRNGRIEASCTITNRTERANLHLEMTAQCMLSGKPLGGAIRGGDNHHVPAGSSEHTFSLPVPEAKRWWPWDCGEPYIYQCRLILRDGERVLCETIRNVGFRRLEYVNWKYRVNGRRIFLRGTSLTPPNFFLSQVNEARYLEDLAACRELNCNMVRVHGFVASDAFYDKADEMGLLVWQDVPLHWHFGKTVLGEAVRQTELLVRRLRHHPSMGFWNCQNEPFLHGEPRVTKGNRLAEFTLIKSVLLPNWNKQVLAPAMHAVVKRLTPGVPSMPYSGCYGIFAKGTDSHWYFGTYYGRFRWYPWLRRLAWRGFRLVSEYGCFAFPAAKHLAALRKTWSKIPEHADMPFGLAPWAWSRFLETSGMARTSLILPERVEEFSEPSKLAELAAASQTYQADLIKFYTEYLRIIRYEPASAAISYQLRDTCLMAGMGLVDHLGTKRESYAAYRESNAPAVVVVDFPRPQYAPGKPINLRVYAINDHPRRLKDCTVCVRLSVEGKDVHTRQWQVALPPDSLTRLDRFRCRLPAKLGRATGELVTELHAGGECVAVNHYRIYVGMPGPR